ncbi:ATP-binding protein [Candidatus Palauibacter sp.]|uniref:ATP-binding protein n=1 Tax=Candidatus Palauibacter sp. TaxID=3101350 RepID=UPI003B023E2B
MFDSKKELLDNIRLGESSFLELKEVRFAGSKIRGPTRDSLADELAAFANSRGGVCLLGVEDQSRQIAGIPFDRLDDVMVWLRQLCTDSIKPPVIPVIERLLLPTEAGDEAAVIKVEIPPSLWVHRSPGGYLHRVADEKRPMSPEYLARLIQHRSQSGIVRFDEQTVSGVRVDALSEALWERFRTPRSVDAKDDLLSKLRLARVGADGVLRPTVAGILMATDDPRRWLPNAFVQAVAYRGTQVRSSTSADPYQLDAADLSGPLDAQVRDACSFVARNMRVAAFKDVGRIDRPAFDMTAVFEAMVNAVAHRDYSIHGSKIRLRLFADRLELYSPGRLPNTMTIENLPYLQSSRYEVLTSLLAKCAVPDGIPGLRTDRRTLMDRRGEGVRMVLDNSQRLAGRKPEYRMIGDEELLLTIFAPGERTEEGASGA